MRASFCSRGLWVYEQQIVQRDLKDKQMWFCRVKPLRHLNVLKESSKSPWLFSLSCTLSCTSSKKSKLAPLQERRMIDRFKLCAKGGDGGSGCVSVRRSRHDRRGRPDGGNGGKGGDVILECSRTHWDFSSLQHHAAADRGGNGASKNKIGTRGADKVVQVPIGTVIHLVKGEVPSIARDQSSTELDPWEIPGYLLDKGQRSSPDDTSSAEKAEPAINAGCLSSHHRDKSNFRKTTNEVSLSSPFSAEEETEEMLYNVAELTEEGQRMIIARGGEGGQGNVYASHISKKPKTSKPSVQNNEGVDPDESTDESSLCAGLTGCESYLVLELKSIADVGLVGMPNAGKSTLLGAISRAKPAVGHYAFTTLRPNLGKLNFDDFSFTVADIPGLIKGAHENRGLGHAFLRHIERTRVLAYVVDLSATLDGRKGIPPWEQLRDLVFELEQHQEGSSDRPSLVVANKIDEEGAELVYEELKARVANVPIYPISAILEEGIPELKAGLKSLVNGDVCDRLNADRIVFD